MTIISKFPGTCTACHDHISVGTQIEWTKGAGARHVQCPASRGKHPLQAQRRDWREVALVGTRDGATVVRTVREDGGEVPLDCSARVGRDGEGPMWGEFVDRITDEHWSAAEKERSRMGDMVVVPCAWARRARFYGGGR